MTLLQEALRRVARDLESRKAAFALVGGLAVSVRCEPRFTRDLDLAVAVAFDAEAERLVRDLMGAGFRVLAHIEQEATGRLATVRLRPPGPAGASGVVVDLLFASSGIEAELAAAAQRLEVFPGVVVPVSTAASSIARKILARDERRRPQDLGDLRQFVDRVLPAAIGSVRRALRRVTRVYSFGNTGEPTSRNPKSTVRVGSSNLLRSRSVIAGSTARTFLRAESTSFGCESGGPRS